MKITYKQFKEIMGYKRSHPIQALLSYQLSVMGRNATVTPHIPLWMYLILFIPLHLFIAVILLWNGGLKEFEPIPRKMPTWHFFEGDRPYEIAKNIWEKA